MKFTVSHVDVSDYFHDGLMSILRIPGVRGPGNHRRGEQRAENSNCIPNPVAWVD